MTQNAAGSGEAQARPAPGPTEPVRELLDPNRLAMLRELDSSLRELDSSGAHAAGTTGSLLRDLVDAFVATVPADVADLRAAGEHDDATAMHEVAHHLKGAAMTLGLAAMAALCAEIETLASSGALVSACDLIPRLEEEFDRARSALDAAVSSR